MMRTIWMGSIAACLLFAGNLTAQAPAGATGQCQDGSYTTAAHKSGACSGHKGVQTWFTADSKNNAPASSPSASSVPQAATPQPTSAAQSSNTSAGAMSRTQATGGGPGLVWVNTSSKVYHCYGGRDYGTTKNGKYESEASAKAEGARPAYGKSCSQ